MMLYELDAIEKAALLKMNKSNTGFPVLDGMLDSIAPPSECVCHKFIRIHDGNCPVHGFIRKQTVESRCCLKCSHREGLSDNEGGTCEARIVLEQDELGCRDTVCGCFCQFPFVACAQCEANAQYNEAGGYDELAKQCRAYCRNGHKEATEKRS